MIVYLSGAMENAGDEGSGWREEITLWLKENLSHGVIDPVIESKKFAIQQNGENYRTWKTTDPPRFIKFIRNFVKHDIETLTTKSDYVICLWDEAVFKGGGTHGEVTLGFHYNIPVYLVNRVAPMDFSGWIQACSTKIFTDFDSLKQFLIEEYGNK